jgi:DNA-binding NarL/FixJ family response regulator
MSTDLNQLDAPRGLLLTPNLLFSSMVTGTAAANGKEVAIAEDLAEAEGLCRDRAVTFVIIDLSVTAPDIATIVARLREAAGAVPMIAFGSHVDKARLDEARAAGCDEVMPRSRFSSELPELLRRYSCGGGEP